MNRRKTIARKDKPETPPELSDWGLEFLDAIESFEESVDPAELQETAQEVIEMLSKKFFEYGLDNVFYGRIIDRTTAETFTVSTYSTDAFTLYGLAKAVWNWAQSKFPVTTRVTGQIQFMNPGSEDDSDDEDGDEGLPTVVTD